LAGRGRATREREGRRAEDGQGVGLGVEFIASLFCRAIFVCNHSIHQPSLFTMLDPNSRKMVRSNSLSGS
jgi:hypothetical protein